MDNFSPQGAQTKAMDNLYEMTVTFLFDEDGKIKNAVNPQMRDVPLDAVCTAGKTISDFVEECKKK